MSACDCRRYTPSLSIKQSVSQHAFKTLNVDAEPRLGAMLSQSRLAEAAFLIGCHKAPNLFEIRGIDEGTKHLRRHGGFRFLLTDSLLRAGAGLSCHLATHNKTV